MPQLEYFLVCESIVIDKDRNLASAFNILDDLLVTIPCLIPQMVALSTWRLQPEDQNCDFQVGFELILPGAGVSQEEKKTFTLNFSAKGVRHRTYFRFDGIPIEQEGDVVFHLTLNGAHIATHVLTVRQTEVQPG
jgi:hypothetical protein